MIARYIALGLLFLIFFSSCRSVVVDETVEEVVESNIDRDVEELISLYLHDTEQLLEKLISYLDGKEHNYHGLLASLTLKWGKYALGEEIILSSPEYKKSEKLLETLYYLRVGGNGDFREPLMLLKKVNPENRVVRDEEIDSLISQERLKEAENLLLEEYYSGSVRENSLILLGDLNLKMALSLGYQDKEVVNSKEREELDYYYYRALEFYLEVNSSQNSQFYNRLGNLYKMLGDKLNAIKSYNKAIEVDPEDEWSYYDKGKLLFYMGELDRALESFLKAYSIDSSHFLVNVFLGRIHFYLDNIDESVNYYTWVLKENPDYYPAWEHYSVLSYIKGYKEISLAYQKEIYSRGIGRDPLLPLFFLETLNEVGDGTEVKKIASELVKYEKNVTMKGIYKFYLDEVDDLVMNEALTTDDPVTRNRLTYYVSMNLYREGVKGLAKSLLNDVLISGTNFESKLARYKLGVLYE